MIVDEIIIIINTDPLDYAALIEKSKKLNSKSRSELKEQLRNLPIINIEKKLWLYAFFELDDLLSSTLKLVSQPIDINFTPSIEPANFSILIYLCLRGLNSDIDFILKNTRIFPKPNFAAEFSYTFNLARQKEVEKVSVPAYWYLIQYKNWDALQFILNNSTLQTQIDLDILLPFSMAESYKVSLPWIIAFHRQWDTFKLLQKPHFNYKISWNAAPSDGFYKDVSLAHLIADNKQWEILGRLIVIAHLDWGSINHYSTQSIKTTQATKTTTNISLLNILLFPLYLMIARFFLWFYNYTPLGISKFTQQDLQYIPKINWNAAATNPQHPDYGITLLWKVVSTGITSFRELSMIFKNSTNADIHLNAAPMHPQHLEKGTTLLWLIMHDQNWESLDVILEKYVLNSLDWNAAPTNSKNINSGISVLLGLAIEKKWELLRIILESPGVYAQVNWDACATHPDHPDKGISLRNMLDNSPLAHLPKWQTLLPESNPIKYDVVFLNAKKELGKLFTNPQQSPALQHWIFNILLQNKSSTQFLEWERRHLTPFHAFFDSNQYASHQAGSQDRMQALESLLFSFKDKGKSPSATNQNIYIYWLLLEKFTDPRQQFEITLNFLKNYLEKKINLSTTINIDYLHLEPFLYKENIYKENPINRINHYSLLINSLGRIIKLFYKTKQLNNINENNFLGPRLPYLIKSLEHKTINFSLFLKQNITIFQHFINLINLENNRAESFKNILSQYIQQLSSLTNDYYYQIRTTLICFLLLSPKQCDLALLENILTELNPYKVKINNKQKKELLHIIFFIDSLDYNQKVLPLFLKEKIFTYQEEIESKPLLEILAPTLDDLELTQGFLFESDLQNISPHYFSLLSQQGLTINQLKVQTYFLLIFTIREIIQICLRGSLFLNQNKELEFHIKNNVFNFENIEKNTLVKIIFDSLNKLFTNKDDTYFHFSENKIISKSLDQLAKDIDLKLCLEDNFLETVKQLLNTKIQEEQQRSIKQQRATQKPEIASSTETDSTLSLAFASAEILALNQKTWSTYKNEQKKHRAANRDALPGSKNSLGKNSKEETTKPLNPTIEIPPSPPEEKLDQQKTAGHGENTAKKSAIKTYPAKAAIASVSAAIYQTFFNPPKNNTILCNNQSLKAIKHYLLSIENLITDYKHVIDGPIDELHNIDYQKYLFGLAYLLQKFNRALKPLHEKAILWFHIPEISTQIGDFIRHAYAFFDEYLPLIPLDLYAKELLKTEFIINAYQENRDFTAEEKNSFSDLTAELPKKLESIPLFKKANTALIQTKINGFEKSPRDLLKHIHYALLTLLELGKDYKKKQIVEREQDITRRTPLCMLIEMIAVDLIYLRKFRNNDHPDVQVFFQYFNKKCKNLLTTTGITRFELHSPKLGHENEIDDLGVIEEIITDPQIINLLRDLEPLEEYLLKQKERQENPVNPNAAAAAAIPPLPSYSPAK